VEEKQEHRSNNFRLIAVLWTTRFGIIFSDRLEMTQLPPRRPPSHSSNLEYFVVAIHKP
jgi:hypothetical protein